MATELNKILSGQTALSAHKNSPTSQELTLFPSSGCCSSDSVPEMLESFYTLTQLSAFIFLLSLYM
jgi:hypothetical protein